MSGIYKKIFLDTSSAERSCRQLESQLRHTAQVAKSEGNAINSILSNMGNIAGGFGLAEFAKKIVEVRGEFQKLEVAFNVLLNSKERASALMSQMIETAAITPFTLQDVTSGAKQLLAYGVAAENVNDTLIRLGDIAAALSIPLGDLAYLYGTTMTQGRLYTRDYVQFLGRGIPLQKELAKVLEISEDKVAQFVKDGKVGFNEINAAIVNMTNSGGLFGGMMKEMSKTFTGQISNIEDQISVIFNEMGKTFAEPIQAGLDLTKEMLDNYKLLGGILGGIIVLRGTEKAVLMATTALTYAAKEKELTMLRFLNNERVIEEQSRDKIQQQDVNRLKGIDLEIAKERERINLIKERIQNEIKAKDSRINEINEGINTNEREITTRREKIDTLKQEHTYAKMSGDATRAETIETQINSEAKAVNALERKNKALATERDTLATEKNTAAERINRIETNLSNVSMTRWERVVKNATGAVKGFASWLGNLTGLNVFANPYGAIAVGILALAGSVYMYCDAMKAMESVEEGVGKEMAENGRTYEEQTVIYEKLRVSWNKLAGDLDGKKKFLEDHQMEMSRLGAATDNVKKAEDFFVTNTKDVLKAYKLRAQAAAASALATKYYQESMQAEAEGNNAKNAKWYEEAWFSIKKQSTIIWASILGDDQKEVRKRFGDDKHKYVEFGTEGMKREAEAREERLKKQADEYQKQAEEYLKQANELFKPDNTFKPGKTTGGDDGKGRTAEQMANDIAKANDAWKKAIRARAQEQAKTLVEMQEQLADAQIEAMRDGFAKVKAEERREHEQNISDIEKDRKERIKAELDQLQKEFDEREDYLVAKSKDKKGKVHYARRTFDYDKAYEEAVSGNVGAGSYLASIDKASAEFVEKVNENARKFGVFEDNRFGYVINKLLTDHLDEEKEKLNSIYEAYGSYEQKLESYLVTLNRAKHAPDATSADIAAAQAEYDRNVQSLQFDKAKAYGDIMMAFEDVNDLTNNALDNVIANMERYKDTILSSLGTKEIEEFNKRLSELEKIRYERQRDGVNHTHAEVKEMQDLLALKIKEKENTLQTLRARQQILEAEKNEATQNLRSQLEKMGVSDIDIEDIGTLYDRVTQSEARGSYEDFDTLREKIGAVQLILAKLGGVQGDVESTTGKIQQLGDALNDVARGGLSKFASFMKDGLQGVLGKDGKAALDIVDNVVHKVNDDIRAASESVNDLKDTMSALGQDTDARTGIGEASAYMNILSDASDKATEAFDALKSGNIMGVVKGVIGSFTSVIKGIAQLKDAKLQARIEDIDKKLHDVRNRYDDIGRKVEKVFSTEAAKNIYAQIRNLKQQEALIKEQMRLEDRKNDTDEDAITEYSDKLRDINNQIADAKEAAIDAIMGEDVKSAINRFADAYTNALSNGASLKRSAKGVVTEMLQNMISESIKQDISRPMEYLRERMNDYWHDKILTESEVSEMNEMASDIMGDIREQYAAFENLFKADLDSLSGSTGAFATMSQESADELNGRFAALQIISQENLLVSRDISSTLTNIESHCWDMNRNLTTVVSSLSLQLSSLNSIKSSL